MISSRLILFAAVFLINQGVTRAQKCLIHVRPGYKIIDHQSLILIQPMVNNGKCLQSQNGNTNGSPVVLADCTSSVDQQFIYSNGNVTMYGGAMCLVITPSDNLNRL
jgi:hypothetical protein